MQYEPFELNSYQAAPEAMKAVAALNTFVQQGEIEPGLLEMAKTRASQSTAAAIACTCTPPSPARKARPRSGRNLLDAWRESPLCTDRERVALAWTEAVTLVSEKHMQLPRAVTPVDRDNQLQIVALDLIEWLSGDECHDLDETGLIAGLGRKLISAGLPIARLSLHLRTLHPEIIGRTLAWAPGEPVEVHDREYRIEQSALFIGSPLQRAMEAREWSTVRLDGSTGSQWAQLDVFRDRGLTDLIVAPLQNADRSVSAVTFGTSRLAGFTSGERCLFERIAPTLRSACEVRILRQSEANLLNAYVGPKTASRILAGHIRRGDVESIEAALLFCDLRRFTELSNRLPAGRVLQLLNLYYDQVVPAVVSVGGEIVKFMGDGILAIFRQDEGPEASCTAALDAAVAALARLARHHQPDAELRAGIALHHGAISYGNIGSGQRLDFTVIGPAVNLTSRLQALCGYEGRPPLLMSAGFADLIGRVDVVPAGRYALKGFKDLVEAFCLVSGEEISFHAITAPGIFTEP